MTIDTDYLVDIPVEDIGVESDQLYKALLGDQCFCLTDICPPKIDFADWEIPGGLGEDVLAEITPLSVDKLTNQEKTGVFDVVSQSIKDLLLTEFDKGRITGAAYAETFVRLIEASLANSTQFLLQRDISYWQARKGFYDAWAVKAQAELTKHNIALVQMQQLNQQTEFAAGKMRVMVAKEQYVTAVVQRDLVVPKQLEAQDSQIAINTKQLDVMAAQVAGQEAQTTLITEQTATQAVQTALSEYQLSDVLPAQTLNTEAQTLNTKAQTAHTESQTLLANSQRTLLLPAQVEAQESQTALNTKQLDVLTAQIAGQEAQTALTTEQAVTQAVQTSLSEYQLSDVIPAQVAGQQAQTLNTQAQTAHTEAQTLNTEAQTLMTDSQRTLVLPKQVEVQDSQIALYNQQVTSYQRDAELKAAKVFTDTWTALSTVNGADDIPAQFGFESLNEILMTLRAKNDLD